MENKRPTLNDPAELALMKEIYFKNDNPFKEEIDPIERLERQEAKYRQNNKSSR